LAENTETTLHTGSKQGEDRLYKRYTSYLSPI
jgi:hypothetical protein